jgi:hypothetical protein
VLLKVIKALLRELHKAPNNAIMLIILEVVLVMFPSLLSTGSISFSTFSRPLHEGKTYVPKHEALED